MTRTQTLTKMDADHFGKLKTTKDRDHNKLHAGRIFRIVWIVDPDGAGMPTRLDRPMGKDSKTD